MLKLIIAIVLLVLVVKYWKQIKDISAAILVLIITGMFVLIMYLHHLFGTWYMLKKKK